MFFFFPCISTCTYLRMMLLMCEIILCYLHLNNNVFTFCLQFFCMYFFCLQIQLIAHNNKYNKRNVFVKTATWRISLKLTYFTENTTFYRAKISHGEQNICGLSFYFHLAVYFHVYQLLDKSTPWVIASIATLYIVYCFSLISPILLQCCITCL